MVFSLMSNIGLPVMKAPPLRSKTEGKRQSVGEGGRQSVGEGGRERWIGREGGREGWMEEVMKEDREEGLEGRREKVSRACACERQTEA